MMSRMAYRLAILYLIFMTVPALVGGSLIQADDGGFISTDVPVDLVLLIDESGSMMQNDPDRLRVDAASLFIQLNQILTKSNRLSIAGFGEVTNIYIEPTNVAMNKQGILEAVYRIKSDQQYTDIKDALQQVRSMLDERIKKNNAVVILLTDGDLGIDDIPIPDDIYDGGPGGAKPDPPSRDTAGDSSADEKQEAGQEQPGADIDREEKLDEYLEEYKEELFQLCREYSDRGIKIFPIAFTPQADAGMLEEISDITGSRLWAADTAADIRNVYLDIFKYLTNTFISVRAQEGQGPFSGSFELADYAKKAAVISVANEYTKKPFISLQAPSGEVIESKKDLEGPSYDIKVVDEPGAGSWHYNIEGDLVLALDLGDIELIDPVDAVYPDGSKIPVMLRVHDAEAQGGAAVYEDFEIRCRIEGPGGSDPVEFELLDDGEGSDAAAGDGIFSYGYEGAGSPGRYSIEFFIRHLPTGASSLKKKVFTVTDYRPVKKTVYLTIENNIISGTPVIIHANLEDYSRAAFHYTVTSPSGEEFKGELLDDGDPRNSDDAAGDGIYSSRTPGLDGLGTYTIEVEAGYESIEGSRTARSDAEVGKFIDISIASIESAADMDTMTVEGTMIIDSLFDSPVRLEAGAGNAEKGLIKDVILEPAIARTGTGQYVDMTIMLFDDLEGGDHSVSLSLIVDEIYSKDFHISFSSKKRYSGIGLSALIGMILAASSLLPLVFLLYSIAGIRPQGTGLMHPRIIAGASLFAVLLIAGIILVLI